MEPLGQFTGFSRKTHAFFASLRKNNNRAWFMKHKDDYLAEVMRPATAFVTEMGQALASMCGGLVADPSPGGSIFRIYKDTRFSRDKTPYKTHLGIYFWKAGGKKLERPGFYFQLDDAGLWLFAGWYIFPPAVLKAYREAVDEENSGRQLELIRQKLGRSGIAVGGTHYKRTPRGYPTDHPRADLLKHTGVYTEINCGRPAALYSPSLVKYCVRQWKRSLPVYEWTEALA